VAPRADGDDAWFRSSDFGSGNQDWGEEFKQECVAYVVCPELQFVALRCCAGVTAHLSSQKAKISYRIHRHMCTQETRRKEMSDASGRKELGHTIPAFSIKTSNRPPQPSTTSLAALATESKLARSHSTNRTSMAGAAAFISATAA